MALTTALIFLFFFFNDTATTEIYTLSLHDALPISIHREGHPVVYPAAPAPDGAPQFVTAWEGASSGRGTRALRRSEEHTSELQSRLHLVCRLLLEKKKN